MRLLSVSQLHEVTCMRVHISLWRGAARPWRRMSAPSRTRLTEQDPIKRRWHWVSWRARTEQVWNEDVSVMFSDFGRAKVTRKRKSSGQKPQLSKSKEAEDGYAVRGHCLGRLSHVIAWSNYYSSESKDLQRCGSYIPPEAYFNDQNSN